MKHSFFLSTLAAATLCVGLVTSTQAAVTAPVGYVKLTFNAQADTPFSLPLNRPKASSGKVQSISGNTITIASNTWTANEFVYADGTQNEHYYLLFTTGVLEGRSFDVTANGTNTITVDPDGGADIANLINDASATDNFEIRPHWTLNTLFPDGAGFDTSPDMLTTNGLILFKPSNLDGINHGASKSYKYVDGFGWVDNANVLGAVSANDTVLPRKTFYILRNTTANAIEKNLAGDVPTTDETVKLFTNIIKQDSYVAFCFPIDLTLDSTGLSTNPLFKKSTDQLTPDGDVLYVFNNATGYNPSTSKGYFYVDGVGWFDTSNTFGGVISGTTSINSVGRGFVIRKASEASTSKDHAKITIPYNPFSN